MSTVEITAHPAAINLPMYEGDDWSLTLIDWDTDAPADWTGWVFQIRESRYEDNPDALVEPGFDDADQATGRLRWFLTGDEVIADFNGWSYDIKGTSPDNAVRTFLSGLVKVERRVGHG